MSDDLISRQAAIDALGDEPEVWSGKDEYEQGLNNQWHYDVNALKAVPSAQPERKKGKWIGVKIGNGDTRYTCSECGASYECDSRDRWEFNFCPNCGAELE